MCAPIRVSVPLGVRVCPCVSGDETEAIWQWPTCSGRCLTNSPKQTIVKQAERQRQQQQLLQQQLAAAATTISKSEGVAGDVRPPRRVAFYQR